MPVSLPAAAVRAVATGRIAVAVTAGVTVTIAAAVTHLAGARAGVGPDGAAIAVARVTATSRAAIVFPRVTAASGSGIATAVVTAASGTAVASAPARAVGIIAAGCVAIIVAAALAQGSTAVNRRGRHRYRRRFRIAAVIDTFVWAAGVRVGPTRGQRRLVKNVYRRA